MPLTTTTRVQPTGKRLKNGYRTTIAFSANPSLDIWERGVKPPGLNGGDPVDTTTMWNTKYRSRSPRALLTNDDVTGTAGYDPKVYPELEALINVEQAITIRLPNGGTLDFFGFLQKFDPSELTEEAFPTASFSIVCTNADPVTGAEADPVYTPPVGGAPMFGESAFLEPAPGEGEELAAAEAEAGSPWDGGPAA